MSHPQVKKCARFRATHSGKPAAETGGRVELCPDVRGGTVDRKEFFAVQKTPGLRVNHNRPTRGCEIQSIKRLIHHRPCACFQVRGYSRDFLNDPIQSGISPPLIHLRSAPRVQNKWKHRKRKKQRHAVAVARSEGVHCLR
jgi:hypothetical protein